MPLERLNAINRLTVVARLLSSAVHDTRNALQIITGHAELFAETSHDVDRSRERSRSILTQAERATQRMQGLVMLGQETEPAPVRFEVRALAEEVRRRLVLPLDVGDLDAALAMARRVAPWFGVMKVGHELYAEAGPRAFDALHDLGLAVFCDLKLHDIPTTVRRAARVHGRNGVDFCNFHTAGGVEMLAAGVEGLREGAADIGLPVPVVRDLAGPPSTSEAARADADAPRLIASSPYDSAVRLTARPPETGLGAATVADTVTVDRSTREQEWWGTGAALTDASVDVLDGRPDLIAQLFAPRASTGARLTWLRLPLTATDLSTTWWSWTRTPGGYRPAGPGRRAIAVLRRQILPVAPDLHVVASPWSAPPSMKTGDSWFGGRLRSDAVPAYARMLVAQARWLVAHDVPLKAITLANEPGHAADYPTMEVSDADLLRLARRVVPSLHALGVRPVVIGRRARGRDRRLGPRCRRLPLLRRDAEPGRRARPALADQRVHRHHRQRRLDAAL